MPQAFSFSRDFDILWRNAAHADLMDRKSLKNAVMNLSNLFIQEESRATPWSLPSAAEAYTLYFHPLNYLRARKAVRQAHQRGFFEGIGHFIDWGCGLGALTRALWDELPESITQNLNVIGVDQSKEALRGYLRWNSGAFPRLQAALPGQFPTLFGGRWDKACLGLSYSLNELKNFDLLHHSPHALLILEPSSFGLARKLQSFRAEALEAGYWAWTPCTHQGLCPLLTQSRKDWCFDRLSVELPRLWEELFGDLPIKNRTITYSSLGLKRTKPKTRELLGVRLVGDDLREKGKTKWLACAGEMKFFLAWLSKWGDPPTWKRGDLLEVPPAMAADFSSGGEIKISPEKLLLVHHSPSSACEKSAPGQQ